MKLGGQVAKFNLKLLERELVINFKADFACINHLLWKNSQAFCLVLHYLIACNPSDFITLLFKKKKEIVCITSCKDALPTKSCFCSEQDLL